MNPLSDGGDQSFVQTNLAPLETVAAGEHLPKNEPKTPEPEPEPDETEENDVEPVVNSMRPVIADALRRCLKQSASNVIAASKRSGFAQWRDEFFAELPVSVSTTLEPACKALGTAIWATTAGGALPPTAETAISEVVSKFTTLHVAVCAEDARNPSCVSEWTNGRADREAEELCRLAVEALRSGDER